VRLAVHTNCRSWSFWTDTIFSLGSSAMPSRAHQPATDAQKSASADQRLRWSELVALRHANIDLEHGEIRIVETTAELDRGDLLRQSPKSRAGRRTVSFPSELASELRWHLDRFAEVGEQGLVFVGPNGAPLRRSNFRPVWNAACARAKLPGLAFMISDTLAARSPLLRAQVSKS